MPLVSVVMPVFNSERFLAEAIESILTQTFTDFELIIIDDDSTDGSAEVIRAYESRDERIRFVQLAENMGDAGARNAGIALASGKYIAFMDSDDISLPDRLQKQVNFLESHPEIGGVGTHANVVYEDLQYKSARKPPEYHALILLEQLLLGDSFVHASLMLRRNLPLDVGVYDETMRYCSDCDLMARLMGRTYFTNIAECLYLKRRHLGQLTSHRNPRRDQDHLLMCTRRLERIWGEAPKDTLDRFAKIKPWSKLSWSERRAAKRDIKRLIDSMIAENWIEPGDRPLLIAVMNRKLERASPRLWQMFCHWFRYRIRRHLVSLRILQVLAMI